MRPFLLLLALAALLLGGFALTRSCARRQGQQDATLAQPSRIVGQAQHADGTQTTTATVLQASRRDALRVLEQANDSLGTELASVREDKRQLARLLASAKRAQAATVFTTRTAAGDTIRQGVVARLERRHLLARDELRVDVEQLTPGNRTLSVQSFQVPAPPPRRWGLGLQAGYGVGPDLVPRPYVGVGVSYNLIRW